MKNQNGSLTVRIDKELIDWLKQKAIMQNCKISDLVRKSISKFKEIEELPEDLLFSPVLHVKSSKAAIMAYRLMEMLANKLVENGEALIDEAYNRAMKDLDKWKLTR